MIIYYPSDFSNDSYGLKGRIKDNHKEREKSLYNYLPWDPVVDIGQDKK